VCGMTKGNMAQKLQDVFNDMQKTKKEQKSIKSIYREALIKSQQLKEITDKIMALKEEKKKIENVIKDEFKSELNKLEAFKTELESNKILMSDLAINEMIKGNLIEIVDEYQNKYEPIFNVRFKKI
jgi:uncharacterized protein (UPF0335 family)